MSEKTIALKERLLNAEGGYYLPDQCARILGITEGQLEQLRTSNKIIGLPVKDGRHVYPKWQFVKHWFWGWQILKGLDRYLAAFTFDGVWMIAAFSIEDSGRGIPKDLIKSGQIELAVSIAASFGEHGCY